MNKTPLKHLVRLRSDNFTPLQRTPWAGTAIANRIKSTNNPGIIGQAIGESWEFSCDPDFPSRTETGQTLSQIIAEAPEEALGPQAKEAGNNCEILVKLLNAADPLSLQVHPSDSDAFLKPNECGKPESWYVLHANAGAGIYLGFKHAMSKEALHKALLDGEGTKSLLNFVPVKAGDYFEIEPAVPHAVGPGILLLEPQRISFAKSGKTYRLWDWGRKYDTAGRIDNVRGKPRELHLKEGLSLVDPETQVGDSFVNQTRRLPVTSTPLPQLTVQSFPKNPYYQMHTLRASDQASLTLTLSGGYAAILCLEGSTQWSNKEIEGKSVELRMGESAFLSFTARHQAISFAKESLIAIVHPSTTSLSF